MNYVVPIRSVIAQTISKRIVAALTLIALMLLAPVPQIHAQSIDSNPDLARECGINMVLVLDASGSIAGNEQDVRDAAQGFIGTVSDSGTQVAIIEFATAAEVVIPYMVANGPNENAIFDPCLSANRLGYSGNRYFDGRTSIGGLTNWEAALQSISTLDTPDLIVFVTDGVPNLSSSNGSAVDAAIAPANSLKGGGSHILTYGVNLPPRAIQNVEKVTDGSNSVAFSPGSDNFEEADYFIGTYGELEPTLISFVEDVCGGSVNVTQELDGDGDLNTVGDQGTSAEGWFFTVDAYAPATVNDVTLETNANGTVSFGIDFGGQDDATIALTAIPPNGELLLAASCNGGIDNGSFNTNESQIETIVVAKDSILTCKFTNQGQPANLYPTQPPAPSCGSLHQEAEDGTLYGQMVVGHDANASGGQYISVPEQQTAVVESSKISAQYSTSSGLILKRRGDYCVTITQAGYYRIHTRVEAPGHMANSFYVQIDGYPSSGYLWDIFPINSGYVHDAVNDRHGDDPVYIYLSKGDHTISFVHRENDARLDWFTLEPVTVQASSTAATDGAAMIENLRQEAAAIQAQGKADGMTNFLYLPVVNGQ